MLLEGSELTKEDRESQLYDGFEHFSQHKGETIHDYYVRFAKLINDMRNIKMTMSRMQLNSKLVNNMLLEWGRFITTVKLNRGLRDSNYDQLYAYLKQHEVHANENKMMLDRFNQHTVDPFALMSNVSNQQHYPQSSTTSSSTYVQPHLADTTQLDSGLYPTDNLTENLTNTLSLLTQSYKTYLPQTNNQLRTSSNPRNQATIQDNKVVIQNVQGQQNRGHGNNARGAGAAGYGGLRTELDMLIQVKQGRLSATTTMKNEVTLDEEQLLFITGGQDNVVDDDVDEQPIQDLALNVDNVFQADDCDAFDSDIDEAPTTQTMFMANLSSANPVYDVVGLFYDLNVLSEETRSDADRTFDFRALDFQITQLTKKVSVLQEQNKLFRVENAKVKQHYKELYDSIKITHSITAKVLASGMYAIDDEPIPPHLRNNRKVHLDYLKHLKESVSTFHEIVDEAKVERPLDRSIASACLYTKHSWELLEYVIGTCPKDFNK
uniref:Integrase, catalytic region, zinc finger, CCHC-type, peptidase aspartic, catalytic n=1 Tax=Tanacetum cinerariifolium TaxID=118510 RepID=A0A699GY95_TANCI|nr:hypothetical protein [Tanacetum cinerariifolium]